MESPRRYPRTLEQAFGPYTSRHVHVDAPRSSLRAWAMYLLILALAIVGAMLTGCTKAEAAGHSRESWLPQTLAWGTIDRTTPDDYGVVCYTYGSRFSCVKVK
jgi:hypothetical protein